LWLKTLLRYGLMLSLLADGPSGALTSISE